jgi:hypothetical protein
LREMKKISDCTAVACTVALHSDLYHVLNVLIGPFDTSLGMALFQPVMYNCQFWSLGLATFQNFVAEPCSVIRVQMQNTRFLKTSASTELLISLGRNNSNFFREF